MQNSSQKSWLQTRCMGAKLYIKLSKTIFFHANNLIGMTSHSSEAQYYFRTAVTFFLEVMQPASHITNKINGITKMLSVFWCLDHKIPRAIGKTAFLVMWNIHAILDCPYTRSLANVSLHLHRFPILNPWKCTDLEAALYQTREFCLALIPRNKTNSSLPLQKKQCDQHVHLAVLGRLRRSNFLDIPVLRIWSSCIAVDQSVTRWSNACEDIQDEAYTTKLNLKVEQIDVGHQPEVLVQPLQSRSKTT